MSGLKTKIGSLAIRAFLALGSFLLFTMPCSVHAGAPNPAAKVLIIYTDENPSGLDYENLGVSFLRTTLEAVSPAPTVDLWLTPGTVGVATGIQTGTLNPATVGAPIVVGNEIPMTQAMLDSYCEVWDVRFLEQDTTSSSPAQSDEITAGDTTFYTNYLAQGGNLFFSMDNTGFYDRDDTVLGFVSSIVGCSIPFADALNQTGALDYTTFNAAFKTADNTLTDWLTDYPGGLLSSNICGGTALTTYSSSVTVLDVQWKPSGGGTLELSMDTNAYCEYAGRTNPGNTLYYQNVYTILANCTVPPTNTMTNTPTIGNTATSTPTLASTATSTSTSTSTPTPSMTPTPTVTNTQTYTVTDTQTNTSTLTNTPINTPTPTNTATITNTQTNTVTNTPIFTFTNTATQTNTSTITPANTATSTNTVTNTPTITPTVTPTPGIYAWPNPFNPNGPPGSTFKIGSVAQNSHVAIYTISGEKVIDSSTSGNNLRWGPLPPSWTGWEWDGRNTSNLYVSTGVYYYVLQSGTGASGPVLLNGKLLVVNGN